MKYLGYGDEYWATDIEGDLIPSTKVHCLCAVNIHTQEEVQVVGPEAVRMWVEERIAHGAVFVGHNFLGYDAPTLNRIASTALTVGRIIDTMVLSMMYNPSLVGGHSLDSWGVRLKFPKGSHSDFETYSEEMLKYCLRDAQLTRLVYLDLLRRMTRAGYSELGLELEHRAWALMKKQQADGFKFDYAKAQILYSTLRQHQEELKDQIYVYWPPELKVVNEYARPFKKDGTPSANYARHCEEYEAVELSPDRLRYRCYGYVAFNIGSPDQRTAKLLELGWKPREFTDAGHPQATVKGKLSPSLVEFVEASGRPEPALIARWLDVNARGNMVNTWIEAYNHDTGCIHGTVWLANTFRYRHSGPNTANIPAVRMDKEDHPLRGLAGVWTYEARDLWTVRDPERRRLVGVDAKGIQLRVLAHYLNNAAFTESVLGGDPHSYNQKIGGFETRPIAKTFIYAFLLGAGDEKVGQIIGGSTRDGKEVKARFINGFPGLAELLKRLENEINKSGRIRLCDGTPIIVTAPHTRLGYLLQGDESRIMKKASVLTARQIQRRKLDVIKVGDIHDEWQNDVLLGHVPEFTEDVLPQTFKESGEFFQYRLPIDCSTAVGLTWAETH